MANAVVVASGSRERGGSVTLARSPWSSEGLSSKQAQALKERKAELTRGTTVTITGPEKRIDHLPTRLMVAVRTAQEALLSHPALEGAPKEARSIHVDREKGAVTVAGGDVTIDANGRLVFAEHSETSKSWKNGVEFGRWTGVRRKIVTDITDGHGFFTRIIIPETTGVQGNGGSPVKDAVQGIKVLGQNGSETVLVEVPVGQVDAVVAQAIDYAVPTHFSVEKAPEVDERADKNLPEWQRFLARRFEQHDVLIHTLTIGKPDWSKDGTKIRDTREALNGEGYESAEGVIIVVGSGASLDIIAPLSTTTGKSDHVEIDRVVHDWQVTGKKLESEEVETKKGKRKPIVIGARPDVVQSVQALTIADAAASIYDADIRTHGIRVVPIITSYGMFSGGKSSDQPKHTINGSSMEAAIAKKAGETLKTVADIRSGDTTLTNLIENRVSDPTLLIIALEAEAAERRARSGKVAEAEGFDFGDRRATDLSVVMAGNQVAVELTALLADRTVPGLTVNRVATAIFTDRYHPETDAEKRIVQRLVDGLAPRTDDDKGSRRKGRKGKNGGKGDSKNGSTGLRRVDAPRDRSRDGRDGEKRRQPRSEADLRHAIVARFSRRMTEGEARQAAYEFGLEIGSMPDRRGGEEAKARLLALLDTHFQSAPIGATRRRPAVEAAASADDRAPLPGATPLFDFGPQGEMIPTYVPSVNGSRRGK